MSTPTGEPEPHLYLSTACLHALEPGRAHLHRYCSSLINEEGRPKIPGRCKWCPATCGCTCHKVHR